MGPDLLLVDGPVLGADGLPRHGLAVAVTGGRISAIGPERDLVRERGPGTETIHLRGRLLLPGFVDAHAHPLWGGLERQTCNLLETPRTVRDYQHEVAASARAHPDRPWVTGGGWSFEAFPGGVATVAMLDEVVPDRPVVLFNRDHHGVWVNSRALRVAGVDAGTPDPADGRIERDAAGHPTGVLHEGAASLVTDRVPPASDAEMDAALREARTYLLGYGVTGWADAILGPYAGQPDPLPAYLRAWADPAWDVGATGALWWDRHRGLEQIDDLLARRARAGAIGVTLATVKIMADGIVENQTAAMLEPYLRHGATGEERGISFVPRDELMRAVPALRAAGFSVHVHAIGDRAVRDTLDAVEAARAGRIRGAHDTPSGAVGVGPPDQVAHLQVVHPDDVPRFGALDVVANAQALWACHEPQMDDFTIPVLGEVRSSHQYPFGAIAAAGGVLALGSDWPVSSPDPWQAVHVAVTRTAPDEPGGEPLLPEQALTLGQALLAGTSGSARAAGLDAGPAPRGRLAVGAVADLVVASANPFTLPASVLGTVRSEMVLVRGSVVRG